MTLTAIAIKPDSPGPVIFRQNRNGFNGRKFVIFKFRTMAVQENGPAVVAATRDDPRVTSIGRLLRSTSIDELPQLLNVLKGDMSLIGPRPHALAHDSYFENSWATTLFGIMSSRELPVGHNATDRGVRCLRSNTSPSALSSIFGTSIIGVFGSTFRS